MSKKVEVIREALRLINRRVGVLSSDPYGLGLSLSQGSALVDIDRHGSLKPNDLVRLLRLDKSTVSRLIEVLVKKQMVSMNHDPSDGRARILTLTANGKKAVKSINQALDHSVSEIFERLEPRDQKSMVKAFENMAIVLEREDHTPSPAAPRMRRQQ